MPQTSSRHTIHSLRAQKNHTPIVALTAYSTPMARRLDPHVDLLLVGDSLGMVLYGMESTLGVTLSMMIEHGKAVMRGSSRALVVVDMPFASYQQSPAQAFENAARILAETGCQAVKLEGGVEMQETISFLTQRGIPVMAHIGMMPQHVHRYGGFRVQGKTTEAHAAILADARAVEQAGAFAVVLEAIPGALAETLTHALAIPTIGIGASARCDGQILVVDDMAGLSIGTPPRFVRAFATLGTELERAAQTYAESVRTRSFPAEKEGY